MKTNLSKAYTTDKEREMNGSWYKADGGVSFLCRRFGGENEKHLADKSKKYYEPHLKALEEDSLDDKITDDITVKIFSEACIIDWKGLEDEDGNDVPYSQELCLEILLEHKELTTELISFANSRNNYKYLVGKS